MSTPQRPRASRENKPRGAHSANDPFDEKALATKNLVEAPLPLIEIVAAVRHKHAAVTVVSSVADQKDLQTKRTESRMTEDTYTVVAERSFIRCGGRRGALPRRQHVP